MIKKSILLSLFLLSGQVNAQTDSAFYLEFFNPNSNLKELVQQYNHQNGYWEEDQLINAELLQLMRTQDRVIQSNEENGYWSEAPSFERSMRKEQELSGYWM